MKTIQTKINFKNLMKKKKKKATKKKKHKYMSEK